MQPTKKLRALLIVSGLLAMAIGGSILFTPAAFYAANGIRLAAEPDLLSEVRAPGGALAVFGLLMLAGVFRRAFTLTSIVIATAVFLSYGASRLVSIALDGAPGPGLLLAAAIELLVGAAAASALARGARQNAEVA